MLSPRTIQQDLEHQASAPAVSAFENLRELFRIPDPITLPSLDGLLDTLLPIISTAALLDTKHSGHWLGLASQIPTIRAFLRTHYANPALWDTSLVNERKYLIGAYPDYRSLTASTPVECANRLLPLKALLLVAHNAENEFYSENYLADRYQQLFRTEDLTNVANALRKSSDPEWKHFHLLLDHVPEWSDEHPENWIASFLSSIWKLPRARGFSSIPGRYDYLFYLFDVLSYVQRTTRETNPLVGLEGTSSPPPSDQAATASFEEVSNTPATESEFNLTTGRQVRARATLQTYRSQRSSDDVNTEATAPEIKTAYAQEDLPSDAAPTPQPIEALEIRYTNYRTAMDNQRLPWAWDCLNPLEVSSLVSALVTPQNTENNESRLSRLLVWLMLLTGQSLSEILNFTLLDRANSTQTNGLIQAKYWQRRIPVPVQAYKPQSDHSNFLCTHADTVLFELPERVTKLAAALGLLNVGSPSRSPLRLRDVLFLNLEQADHLVRKYLELLRGREMRLLVGRLRKVLSKEVMLSSQNPVLTHLITALPTDAPPSGVYYSAFSVTQLQAAYNEAVNRIMRGSL